MRYGFSVFLLLSDIRLRFNIELYKNAESMALILLNLIVDSKKMITFVH